MALGLLATVLGSCSSRDPSDTLARVGSERVTLADLDAYLLAGPEAARRVPAGGQPDAWLEGKVRRLALERVLLASKEMARLVSEPEVAGRRERVRTNLLASALLQELLHEVEPEPEAVAARLDELKGQRPSEPLLNFQHIFFRLDRGGDPRAVRARAAAVAAEAHRGGDFPALVREHSESANAATGGLVQSVRPSDLEAGSAAALAALDEGGISPVIETRTGLHLFRLIRRLEPAALSSAQLEAAARSAVNGEQRRAARERLIDGLREEASREDLDEEALLAAEATARGLETPKLTAEVERLVELQLLERIFNERRRAFDAELGEEVLRPYFDAQPSAYLVPEKTHLRLIFVPQGRDSFATQQRLEGWVAELRAGRSFEEVAREISAHRSAEDGGDLGSLTAQEIARYGPAVAAAVPELDPGEISEPVYCTGRVLSRDAYLLRGGFAILQVAERQAPRARSFEAAIDDVRRAYAAANRLTLDRELQDQILAEANFELVRLPEAGEFLR